MPSRFQYARLFVALMLFSLSPTQANAQFATKAEYAIVMDAASKAVLYEKNSDTLMAPASMSKLMTLAVVFQQLKEGKLTLANEFTVSEYAWRTGGAPSGGAAMFAPLNTTVKLEDLLPGIIVQSGNDACIILAEGIAGTEEAFAQIMNDYARRIGLTKSNFANSTGLPDPRHRVTARELAELAHHMINEFPEYYQYFKVKEFKYRKHNFFNRNPLIYLNIGADGMKTGHTEESGYGVVASAESQGRRLIVVMNGLTNAKDRKEEAVKMINWGFNSFKQFSLFEPDEVIGDARVWGGDKRYVQLKGDGQVKILLPIIMRDKKINAQIVYNGPLKPPIKAGDKIAELVVTAENGVRNSAPLYAAEDVQKGGVVAQGFDSLLILAFGWLL
ncbi:MAG: D-alanyl-D-alanine carboxypeptidase family protein [Hyphomicrobiales bacterium]|nr:D-alanyl-D-alanine carboxypeptidase family protein [Hyphomicrobiales bacterium]